MDRDEIKADLDALERKIEQLKVEYEKFFVSITIVEPTKLKHEINQIIRKYASSSNQIRNVMLNFRYRNLMARFLTYQEYWNRILRLMEEGKNPKDYRKAMEQFQADLREGQSPKDQPSHQAPAEDRYGTLYQEYLAVAKQLNRAAPDRDAFTSTIKQYEATVREKYGTGARADFRFEGTDAGIKIRTKIKKGG